MNEPVRLRDGGGAARRLMAGAALPVPSAARRRAVAFTSTAATLGASTTAVAASATSLVKSFVLCMTLGAIGGGVMSLAASETVARFEKSEAQAWPAPRVADESGPRGSVSRAPEPVATETPPSVVTPPVVEAVAKDASSKAKSLGRDEAAAPSVDAAAPVREQTSLFEQQRIIESVRAAVARGDVRTATVLLDNYERAYATKQFGPEALALRIEALRGGGQLGAARALAADFARDYPHHPLLAPAAAMDSPPAPPLPGPMFPPAPLPHAWGDPPPPRLAESMQPGANGNRPPRSLIQ